jgi:hypothetical protein
VVEAVEEEPVEAAQPKKVVPAENIDDIDAVLSIFKR